MYLNKKAVFQVMRIVAKISVRPATAFLRQAVLASVAFFGCAGYGVLAPVQATARLTNPSGA